MKQTFTIETAPLANYKYDEKDKQDKLDFEKWKAENGR